MPQIKRIPATACIKTISKRFLYQCCLSLAFSILALLPTLSLADQKPRSLATDSRLKVVGYQPQNIVTLIGHPLIDTQVQLNPSEQIIDIHLGDPLAWAVDVKKTTPSIFFIKPILLESDTNMTVTTDQRSYYFNLRTSLLVTHKNVTYALRFDFPEAKKDHAGVAEVLTNSASPLHLQYTFRGSKAVAPIQAFDNGRFTVLTFAKHTALPAIFSVDPWGHESLVNFSVQGDAVWIQNVHAKYRLRCGREIATVYNESFNLR